MAKSAGDRSKTKAAKGRGDVLVVGTKVKEYVRSKNVNCSGELVGALSDAVRCLIDKAVSRAGENGRKTVQPRDL
ncbi:MAG: hypothetical protein HY719_01390 [Planctomycetes bacterium]|nr:hypothetical protein [Planctomycetota bacterium]